MPCSSFIITNDPVLLSKSFHNGSLVISEDDYFNLMFKALLSIPDDLLSKECKSSMMDFWRSQRKLDVVYDAD